MKIIEKQRKAWASIDKHNTTKNSKEQQQKTTANDREYRRAYCFEKHIKAKKQSEKTKESITNIVKHSKAWKTQKSEESREKH